MKGQNKSAKGGPSLIQIVKKICYKILVVYPVWLSVNLCYEK